MSGDNKMTSISSSSTFFKDTLSEMDKMRDETWSDVTLKVSYRSIYAHRLVLASHSRYFKTMFLSNFSESKSKEIDLSSVVEEADILERIVKYMYCGEIEYEGEELWEVARLASYFEIEVLMDSCQDKMLRKITLENSVEYYMFARSHGYQSIDDVTNEVIEIRFHDYFVFQESTLELKPANLKLMLDWGFFKNSGIPAFLEFLGNWVIKGCSHQYFEVAKEILDYLDEEVQVDFTLVAHKTPTIVLEECCKKLESKLQDMDTRVGKDLERTFVNQFKQKVDEVAKAEEIPVDDEEKVLVALCERKKQPMLLDPKYEGNSRERGSSLVSRSDKQDWDITAYDVFLYRGNSKCWYHIISIENRPLLDMKKLFPYKKNRCNFFVVNNSLLFVKRESKFVSSFDMEQRRWSQFELQLENDAKKSEDLDWFDFSYQKKETVFSDIGKHFAVCNNELFVVTVKVCVEDLTPRYLYESSEVNGCYLEVCRVDIQTGNVTKVAKSSIKPFNFEFYYDDLKSYEVLRSWANLQINEESRDMLVLLHIDDDVGAFFEMYAACVINLKDGSSHFFPAEVNKQLIYPFRDLYIVEKEDCFLVVHHFDEDLCEIVAEYKFLSKDIVFRQGIQKPVLPEFNIFDLPEEEEARLYDGGGTGLWYFSGYWNYSCDFKYIPLEDKRKGKSSLQLENIEISEVNEMEGRFIADDNENGDRNKAADVTKEQSAEAEQINNESSLKDANAKEVANEGINFEDHVMKERNVEGSADEDIDAKSGVDTASNDDVASDKEKAEGRQLQDGVEGIPPPFTNVKSVCEANMDKNFLSTLKPVKMFLL